jgi:acyl carrier protein
MTPTLERLQDLLIESYGIERERLGPDAELSTLGVDSLGLVELLFQIEDRFGVQIPGDAPTDLRTVRDVVDYVDTLLAARTPAGPGDGVRADA